VSCCNTPVLFPISPQNISLSENGNLIDNYSLDCPSQMPSNNLSAALVFDCSSSTDSLTFSYMKEAAQVLFDNMDFASDMASVICFSDTLFAERPATYDKYQLLSTLDTVSLGGKAVQWDAINEGIRQANAAGTSMSRGVIIVTNGYDNKSTIELKDVLSLAVVTGVRVYVIRLASNAGEGELMSLVNSTGGMYFQASKQSSLISYIQRAYLAMHEEKTPDCHLSYTTDCPDGNTRAVTITVSNLCSGNDTKSLAYLAPFDINSLQPVRISLGTEICDKYETVDIPLILSDIPLKPFNSAVFYIGFPNPPISITQVTTDGTLLDGMTALMSPVEGGVRVQFVGRKFISTTGTLAVFRFQVGGVYKDSTFMLELVNWNFESGCLYAVTVYGAITVLPILNPVISASGSSVLCEGDSLMLTASMGFKSYLWSPGGQTTRSIFVRQPGSYIVTARDSADQKHESVPFIVNVNPKPDVSITPSGPTDICEGKTVTLDAGPGFTSYRWSTGDTSQSIVVRSSGFYTVTVKNSYGCKGTSPPVEVKVNRIPIAVYADGPTILCEGSSVNLSASAGFKSYLWSTGETTQSINVTRPGTYHVDAVDPGGCKGTSYDITVTSIPAPHPEVTVSGPVAFCEGGSVELTADSGYAAYHWSSGDSSRSIIAQKTGYYTVTVIDSDGCSGTSQPVSVSMTPNPRPVISPAGGSICEGDSITLDAGDSYNWYEWSDGSHQRHLTVHTSGTYHVSVSDATGCTGTSGDVTVTVMQKAPTPSITRQGDSLIATKAQRYQWYRNGLLLTGETNQWIVAKQDGSYSVQVFDNDNDCGAISNPMDVVLAVEAVPEARHIELYPDPHSGIFTLNLHCCAGMETSIYITDLLGRIIYRASEHPMLSGQRILIDMTSQPAGLYFVHVSTGAFSITRTIVKR
jgi:hypothetical protein